MSDGPADEPPGPGRRDRRGRDVPAPDESRDGDADDSDMGDLFDDLSELADTVDSHEEREQVRETMRTAMEVQNRTRASVFGRVVSGFDRSDAAEALLGALLFGFPMFVEGGTQEVGKFVSRRPAYLGLTLALGVGLTVLILYVADIQDVRVHDPLFGLLPRKFVGVVSIAFLTSLVMMTAWGRVDWTQPWLAFCRVSVAFAPMAIGAALGDLLPG